MSAARRGFTIVETLTALALLVLLIGTIFVFMGTITERRDRVVGLAGATRDALAMMDQLEADLHAAVASDPVEGAGIVGDSTSVRVVFRSVWLRGSLPSETPRDALGASYTFDEPAAVVEGERWAVGASEQHRLRVTLCRGVGALTLRYFDGRAWTESFDSAARGGLPAAVEVRIWNAGRSPETFGPEWSRIIHVPDGGVGELVPAGGAP